MQVLYYNRQYLLCVALKHVNISCYNWWGKMTGNEIIDKKKKKGDKKKFDWFD